MTKRARTILSRRPKITIIVIGLLVVSVLGIMGVLSWHHNSESTEQNTTAIPPIASTRDKSVSRQDSVQTSDAPTSDTKATSPTQSPLPTPSTPPQNTQKTQKSQPTQASPPTTSGVIDTPRFTAGRIDAGVVCYGTTYHYQLATVAIQANRTGAGSFSWRIELNNGAIYKQGSNAMYNTTVWPDYPNTPGFPDSLGWIDQPADGLAARFVIVSPNYSAGAWSQPVPVGSGSSCYASRTYGQ